MPGQHLEVESRHRHQRAGIAGRHRDVGLALLDRIDGQPHRRFAAAVAQRLARLVVHADRDVGVNDPRGRLAAPDAAPSSGSTSAVAEQQELGVGMAGQRKLGAGNGHGGP